MDTLFFIASKVFWTIARPESWIVLLLFLSFIAFRRDRARCGRRYLASSLVLVLAIGTLPLGELLLRPLETRFPPDPHVDDPVGIIILGGGEDSHGMLGSGLPEVNEAGDRFLAGIALAGRYPDARIIFTGGSGHLLDQSVSGSDVAERIFEDAGIREERILLERTSRNTAENAALTRDLFGDDARGPSLLVTSAFHMPRAVGTFCAAGWRDVVPYPVDFRHSRRMQIGWDLAGGLTTLNTAVKEWLGLVAYRATGRITRLLPEAC